MLVHGANLRAKENHKTKYKDADSKRYLAEIRSLYDDWHKQNTNLIGPGVMPSESDIETVKQRVALF